MTLPVLTQESVSLLDVKLERDLFLRTLLRELAGTLQDVVGLKEAAGFVSVVGQNMGISRDEVARVLVDLKRRIQGQFHLIEVTDDKIVLGNSACPFAEKVLGRPALCMMTSNVFGSIAAENLGYAKVALEKTIAQGDLGCRVVVYLRDTADSQAASGREYVKS
jgi:predicted ArsR family transcriptional regulator